MKTIVLLSGGLDSAVVLAMFRNQPRIAIGFDYGQPHVVELQHAGRIAAKECAPFTIYPIRPSLPKTNDLVFAGRNAVMLTTAAAIAQSQGFDSVAIGCNANDRIDFPDCRFDFISNLSKALESAYGVKVLAPLIDMSKREVVEWARKLGVDIEGTYTCYRGGNPCGECYACKARAACSQ